MSDHEGPLMVFRFRTIPAFHRLLDWLFPYLERLDIWQHELGISVRPFCRLVGKIEIGYYERATDWDNPIYVKPGTEMFEYFSDRLCIHGYSDPRDCQECLQ